MESGKSPLERVNIECGGDSPPSGSFRGPIEEHPSTDDLLRLLSSGRRRRLVSYLDSRDEPVFLSEAVSHATENERNGERRTSVVTDFRHVHLPKLADADVVRYDREAEMLEPGANARRTVRILESVTGELSSDPRDGHGSNPLAELCSTDVVFRLLADETRRFLFSLLRECDERVALDDLAERVAAWTADKPVAKVTADERRTAKIELHHKQLPMLADAGILEYDRTTKTFVKSGRAVAAAEWLGTRPSSETFEAADGA